MNRIETAPATQVYRISIQAAPQAIWDAITRPEWTQRYGYRAIAEYDLRPGGRYRALWSEEVQQTHGIAEVAVDGEVVEADPPHRLVQTWRMVMDPTTAAEGFTRLTWEITAGEGGMTLLTVTHELEGAPRVAALVGGAREDSGAGGGWKWILAELKALLEAGIPAAG